MNNRSRQIGKVLNVLMFHEDFIYMKNIFKYGINEDKEWVLKQWRAMNGI